MTFCDVCDYYLHDNVMDMYAFEMKFSPGNLWIIHKDKTYNLDFKFDDATSTLAFKFKKNDEIKNKITEWVFQNVKRPEQYEFLRRFNELLVDIENRELNIDFQIMKDNISKDKDLVHYRRLLNVNKNISYNLFINNCSFFCFINFSNSNISFLKLVSSIYVSLVNDIITYLYFF